MTPRPPAPMRSRHNTPRKTAPPSARGTPRVALIAAVAANGIDRRRQPAAVAARGRPEALSRADDRPRGDHGAQDLGIAAARAARAAEHRRDAAARLRRRRAPRSPPRSTDALALVRLPEPGVLHRRRRALSCRAAVRVTAAPDRDRPRLRRRRAIPAVRRRTTGGRPRARRTSADGPGRLRLRLRDLRSRRRTGVRRTPSALQPRRAIELPPQQLAGRRARQRVERDAARRALVAAATRQRASERRGASRHRRRRTRTRRRASSGRPRRAARRARSRAPPGPARRGNGRLDVGQADPAAAHLHQRVGAARVPPSVARRRRTGRRA